MNEFINILNKPEMQRAFLWSSRFIEFTKAFSSAEQVHLNHEEIKESILNSDLVEALESLELDPNIDNRARIQSAVREILDEIGYKRSIPTIRWLAYLVTKILRKTLDGIYVNETALMNLKETMGTCPVVLVPTHRSYGDFILMAFICFTYGIEIPCVAAGIDFLSMRFMGEILRKTKAFFIRRTFQDDKLYKVIFAEYVAKMVKEGNSPLEFFIEGTRSRNGKSLKPKYGFLSMILKPFLDGDVPDIKLVPVSICYDRFLEEWLFTREQLGVPKPKESTRGLLNAFSILNEKYGNVYFNFGEPISVRDWVSRGALGPIPRPVLHDVRPLADQIIESHTELQVLGAVHIIMLVMYENLIISERSDMSLNAAIIKFDFVLSVMEGLGLHVLLTKGGPLEEITYACSINPALIGLLEDNILFYGREGDDAPSELLSLDRGVMLMLYVNPVAAALFCPALLLMLVAAAEIGWFTPDLKGSYYYLCEAFEFEFPITSCDRKSHYENVERFLLSTHCISLDMGERRYSLSENWELIRVLYAIAHPYIQGYAKICELLMTQSRWNSPSELSRDCELHLRSLCEEGTVKLPFCVTKAFISTCISAFRQMKLIYLWEVRLGQYAVEINNQGVSELENILYALSSINPASNPRFKAKL